jgi:hypothetical protein
MTHLFAKTAIGMVTTTSLGLTAYRNLDKATQE